MEEGLVGCANCSQTYPVSRGVADLRYGSDAALEIHDDGIGAEDRAFRSAALMGTQLPSAPVLVLEPRGAEAVAIAEVLPEAHVVAASPEQPVVDRPQKGEVSRTIYGSALPYRTHGFRAAAVLGTPDPELLAELQRVLAPGARLVIDRATPAVVEMLSGAGFEVLLNQDRVVVAAIPGRR